MTNNLKPARVVAPGRILSRELDARGWTQKDLAKIIKRPPQTINEIIQGTKQITPETAIELSQALGTSPTFWTNLEANYRLFLANKQKDDSDIERRSRLYTVAPVAELIKRQWIKPTEFLDELEKNICDFLGINSPLESPKLAVNFRHNDQLDPEKSSLISWMKRVEYLAKKRKIEKFKLEQLKTAIPNILAYSEKEEQIINLPKLFKDLGIHFIMVPHLNKTYLDGAMFYLEKNPVIALTLRYNRIDYFWFTLMHEIGHIFAGHQGLYLDNMDQLEDNEQESEANQLARDWLIHPDALEGFIQQKKGKFSSQDISDFANIHKRHPGIILGRLHYDKLVPYQNLRKYLVRVNSYLTEYVDR
ncbi:HigA family addiction module antitoxin [Aphanothece sacrum]|uniref:Addiction module antidote protein n=1 Tax=Aphanothece sacrum FPU1 TaxID=1920663 RepID=A0A401ICA0_APHSA|nr:HigA family addiction module antitoxin [Aphanothece sacrum]GBF78846.1 addiction module antidote protein [Aphanothece sacrum FPU1]GBF83078.1 addiction module antidote protein, HigA family [Aphanothece sacrum FPU3]